MGVGVRGEVRERGERGLVDPWGEVVLSSRLEINLCNEGRGSKEEKKGEGRRYEERRRREKDKGKMETPEASSPEDQ